MKVLIVDDEPLARDRLRRLMLRLRPQARLLEAGNGREALAVVDQSDPELVLLDVRMPEMDGVAVATQLATLPRPPAVIFCTAYDEYALEALNQNAIAYLLKPVREAALQRALENAVRINRAQLAALRGDSGGRSEICSSSHHGVAALAVDDIRCFLAEDKYLRAVAPEEEILINETLKDLEREFGDRFLRVHRNALVARRHLRRLRRTASGWVVELTGVDPAPAVSRRHLAAIKAAIAAG